MPFPLRPPGSQQSHQLGSRYRVQQFNNPRQIVAQLLLHHDLKLFVDHTHVTIPCTQIDSAVELHQRWPPFWRKVGKANVVYFVRFWPPLLIINSLDASGGSVFLNFIGVAEGALIRAAASTQPFGGSSCSN